jgi:hypothetical protein
MSDRAQCVLCGREDHDVKERLVEWTDALIAKAKVPRWDSAFRCPDYQACRSRVEVAGGTWPVRDVVTRPTVTPSRPLEEVPI